MLDYKDLKSLYNCLKHWKTTLKNIGLIPIGWEITKHFQNQILVINRVVICGTRFVALTCDEITTFDNQSSISIHGYCVQDWCHIFVLLLVEHIVEGSNAQKLTKVILAALINFGGMIEKEIANQLLCFGANSVNIF
jgi:hypothetical protein